KCHAGRASGKLADDAAEDACEKNNLGKSCLEKFQASVTKAQTKDTSGLCNCISGSGLAGTIESQLDVNSRLVYCASPSRAFLNSPGPPRTGTMPRGSAKLAGPRFLLTPASPGIIEGRRATGSRRIGSAPAACRAGSSPPGTQPASARVWRAPTA